MAIGDVRSLLAGHRDKLAGMGVLSLRVFGSVARGEAGPDSDVDFLIELDPERQIDLLDFAHSKGELKDMLGYRVDLVEPVALKPRMRERVLKGAVPAA